MSLDEATVHGTLNPDGTLELDQKPDLPAGRVTVVLRQESEIEIPTNDPFWQRMQTIWNAQKANGAAPRTVEEIEEQQREMREGWAKRQEAIEQLQVESRRRR